MRSLCGYTKEHSLNTRYATLETCSGATDTVVVIDVIRAFTTAAFAFSAGAHDIVPIDSVQEALALRERFPHALVMGCGRDRLPPSGFDYGNSPAALMGCDFGGRRIILYTPNGTRGIVRSKEARSLLASSFVCAQATAEYIKRLSPNDVTFVTTGPEGEDQDCAEYIAGLIGDQVPDISALLAKLRNVWLERFRTDVAAGRITEEMAAGFEADLACCTLLNRFDFAMVVRKQKDLLVMEATH